VSGHSGENQFSILLLVLEDYGIVRQLGAIIVDNASSNNVLYRFIEIYFYDTFKIEWNADDWQIRCIDYIINLVVQAFLFVNVIGLKKLESYDNQNRNGNPTDEEVKRFKFRLLGPLN
jgi:hypothetical protein